MLGAVQLLSLSLGAGRIFGDFAQDFGGFLRPLRHDFQGSDISILWQIMISKQAD